MGLLEVKVSVDAIKKKLYGQSQGVRSGMRSGVNAAVISLATVIKRDYLSGQVVNRITGNLSRAIFSRMTSDTSGMVGIGDEAPYGRFINDGTAPSIIEARAGGVLRFVINGHVIFAKSVHHPGIKARHFMEDALAAETAHTRALILAGVRQGMNKK